MSRVSNSNGIAQTTGLKRQTSTNLEKYYTCPDVAQYCMELLATHLLLQSDDICIEPSAGNGAFIPHIHNMFEYSLFYDISPEHPEIVEQDYLTLDERGFVEYPRKHIVGNPPFGRQSSEAIKFIKKSAKFAHSISFILPRSFKKESMKKHFPLEYHLVCEEDIPCNAFLINGEQYDVPCVFQIWEKKDTMREAPVKLKPCGYSFVKREEAHDIAFRRVGFYAGKIIRVGEGTQSLSPQSHHFIKFDKPFSESQLKALQEITFKEKNHTVGAKSISKQELIREFNQVMD